MKVKLLLLALALTATAQAETHLYVFGDSLSSPTGCSWPEQLQDEYVVHNYAQAGLTLKGLNLPSHLYIRKDNRVVIYLGTNDAGQNVGVKEYTWRLKELIYRLKIRGGNVYVVAQPKLDALPNISRYRKVSKKVANGMRVSYIDPGWGTEVTTDGIHQSCNYNEQLSSWFYGELK